MRTLTPHQKGQAAEFLGIAYSHLKVARVLIKNGENASAIPRLYYAAYFAARAVLVESGFRSKKHSTCVGEFNRQFGRGGRWVPRQYAAMLNKLLGLRELFDYEGAIPNDEIEAKRHFVKVEKLLAKVRSNTPLLLYPEFIEQFLSKHPEIEAFEFDYYCPRSYSHKERIQAQVQAASFSQRYVKQIVRATMSAIKILRAKRKEDYVLGWNSRFGYASGTYILFLDIDEADEGRIKQALRDRAGWLFKSGEGYHFIGQEILGSHKRWMQRLSQAARSRALKKLIDQRHVEYSVLRGYGTLRINGSEAKNFIPFLCWDNSK